MDQQYNLEYDFNDSMNVMNMKWVLVCGAQKWGGIFYTSSLSFNSWRHMGMFTQMLNKEPS